jgi:hypothetical protein
MVLLPRHIVHIFTKGAIDVRRTSGKFVAKKTTNHQKTILILLIVFCLLLSVLSTKQAVAIDTSNEVRTMLEEELNVSQDNLLLANAELIAKDTQLTTVSDELERAVADLLQQERDIESLTDDISELETEIFNSSNVIGIILTDRDVELIAKTVWGEGRGVSKIEQSLIVWCILNRVDAHNSTIAKIVTAKNQFHGYHPNNPVDKELVALVKDVIARWQLEQVCTGEVGRTLPPDYLWFHGDGTHNWFRNAYTGNYDTWDWTTVWNPYA